MRPLLASSQKLTQYGSSVTAYVWLRSVADFPMLTISLVKTCMMPLFKLRKITNKNTVEQES